jgi:hypothetical protein
MTTGMMMTGVMATKTDIDERDRSDANIARFNEGRASLGVRCCAELECWEGVKRAVLWGFFEVNVSEFEQNLKKPEKTCGNRSFTVDKALGKDEGELRYSSPHPHEH